MSWRPDMATCRFVSIWVREDGPPAAIISVDGTDVAVDLEIDTSEGEHRILPLDDARMRRLFSEAERVLRTN